MDYDKVELRTIARPHEPRAVDSTGATEGSLPLPSPGKESRGKRPMQKPAFPIHSYPWYVHDWRQSMMRLRLSPLGRYVYRELLDQCYIDGSIPNDKVLLAKIVDVPARDFAKLWPEVSRAFELREDGNYHHPKADAVLNEIVRWKEQKSNAGRASGNARRATVERPLNTRSTAVEPSVAVAVSVPVAVANAPIPARPARGRGAVDSPYEPTGDTGLHERFIEAFLAAGCKLSEAHVLESCRTFISFDEAEQAQIVEHAERKARVTEARYMGLPARYLEKGEWRAKGTGRTLPPPAKGLDQWQEFSDAVDARLKEDGLL